MTTRAEIVAEAQRWVDVPYRHLGRNKFGVDCAGLLIKVAHECELSSFDTTAYSKRPNSQEFLHEIGNVVARIPKTEAKNSAILVMRGPRRPCHLGILEIDKRGQRYVIHSFAPYRKVVRQVLTDEEWDQVVFCYDFPGVTD